MDWVQVYADIEDKLFNHYSLDISERALYYYLLRKTRLAGNDSSTIPLSQIVSDLGISESKARDSIRSLAKKGCIEMEQTRTGHAVKALLPDELNLPGEPNEVSIVDIEQADFFSSRKYLSSLLSREHNKCFYCLRDITADDCELDHVIAQVNGGNNNYRNIVASCHQCNTRKQGADPQDYLRTLLRKSAISEPEFEDRLKALELLQDGQLKPLI